MAELQATHFPAFVAQHSAYVSMCEACDALFPTNVVKPSNPYAVHSSDEIVGKWNQVGDAAHCTPIRLSECALVIALMGPPHLTFAPQRS